jgi:hypothetical protein
LTPNPRQINLRCQGECFVPVSAVDCVQPALRHVRQQLFSKFRLGQWSRLALVGILAGELYVGGCGVGNIGKVWRHSKPTQEFLPVSPFPHMDPARVAQFAGLFAVIIFLAIVLFFVFLYINSVFRFILFDGVLRRECSIGDGWQRWRSAGRRYFLWQLVLAVSSSVFLGLLIGVPFMMIGVSGLTRDFPKNLAGMAGALILLVIIAVVCLLIVAVTKMLAKDFLVPIMALEDLDFADGWSRLIALLRADPGAYAVYVLLKLAMIVAAMLIFTMAAIIPILVVAIPGALFIVAGAAAGMGWNPATITLVIVLGIPAFLILLYMIAMVGDPATVFFPAYAMYFFAARYPNLAALVYPAPLPPLEPAALETPPTPEMPPVVPPLSPNPEPIG